MARGSSPESPDRRVRMIFLVYCIASLFYYFSDKLLSTALHTVTIVYCVKVDFLVAVSIG